ncbi:hypothetical protein CEY12_11575 [Chryseobacterium sp. T16E-39]|uniref:hypothetical protein n=1 Tax=Chryseobacterium sp. T16E-39 TaxID=2015076 RepID=UPI000B5B386E|nr:hypothetical protein [Chryseobacterium sp. T16E-39]ASK30716.1 hypothetical protein CEY12_11575 [Chryseobacterium sp. T16E-39]
MNKYILLLIAFFFVSCNFNKTYHNREEDKQDAEKITERFYYLIKNDDRQEAFKLIGSKFFETTNKKQLNQMIDDINAECGDKISNTKLTIWETFVSVGTNPKSQYVLSYKVKRNIQNTREKITLEKDDDSIKIVGYDVNLTK